MQLVIRKTPGELHALADLLASVPTAASLDVVIQNGADADAIKAESLAHEPRLPPIRWHKHAKTKKAPAHWSATWEGHALRVERSVSKADGVVFEGFIDHGYFCRSKSVMTCRGRVDAEAVRRRRLLPV